MSAERVVPAEEVAKAWQQALALWDVVVSLSPVVPLDWSCPYEKEGREPLAYIDLSDRQIVVNFALLDEIGARESLCAVLAHEIGHHVRYPHTLGLVADLTALEQRLIPGLAQSLTNLFFDLLVNEVVGRTRAQDLCRVYRGFRERDPQTSPLFFFYLAVYEELWSLEPGALVPAAMIAAMEEQYPGCRAEARVFAQTFYTLNEIHLQFVYFCARFLRYIPDPDKLKYVVPMGADIPMPDVDDYDAVLRGNGSAEADEAIREARERGLLDDSGLLEREADDPLTAIDRITRHMPGHGQGDFKQALVSKHYKRLVEQYILKLPVESPPPEACLPSVPEDWEWGDNPRGIDWTATVLVRGPLAGVMPLKRDLLPDEPAPAEADLPAVEIYLDTSGSMPDPASALNMMTLAAQILAASAIRKRGMVRGIVYSSGKPLLSPWMYDEEIARRFLLSYAGGGTDFPFELLKKLAAARSDVIRVIISDSDFLYNVQGSDGLAALRFASAQSRLLVAFLAVEEKWARETLKDALVSEKFRLAIVPGLGDFARGAAELADALLPR
ncbi:MAG: M48 family metalloprotease [Vicinamibacteria bacterium]|jgi:hypothetical protein|nr:M48 family metalloprotease [Vicinamibacteria bacterium]